MRFFLYKYARFVDISANWNRSAIESLVIAHFALADVRVYSRLEQYVGI